MHIIIGGGIAGIFIGMQLFQKKQPFIIFEKSETNIGKLITKHINDSKHDFELGASVFHKNQNELFQLFEFFGLEDKVHFFDQTQTKTKFIYNNQPSEQIQSSFDLLKNRIKKQSKRFPLLTIEELAKQVLTEKEFDELKTCWNSWYENNDMNAKSYFEGEESEGQYGFLKGGLEQITIKAREKFQNAYQTGKQLIKCEKDKQQYRLSIIDKQTKQNIIVLTDHLYLCLSIDHYKDIRFENMNKLQNYLDYGESRSSLRFYTIFKNKVNQEYSHIVGKIKSKWILKHTSKIWLGPYIDGKLADETIKESETQILERLIQDLDPSKSINDVEETIGAYWKDAITILKTNFFVDHPRLFFIEPGLYCTSIPKSKEQAWMNGHLFLI